MKQSQHEVAYGKGSVLAYRTYLPPLVGIKEIPESSFKGRSNILFATNIQVKVAGEAFRPSFSEGDNSLIVATDSMKNFIQRHLGSYNGSTMEGFLDYVAKAFLNKYHQISSVELTGDLLSFEKMDVLNDEERLASELVFKQSNNEQSQASLLIERTDHSYEITKQQSSLKNLQLIKVQGNSFSGFIRDEYTTLPEDSNRPLFIYLDIHWVYEHEHDALGDQPGTYVAAEQIRDLAASIFDQTETKSIQHLIYEIGCTILSTFPQLRHVSFESQNHTWDLIVEDIPGSDGKVYTEPRPPYGFQLFTVTREDVYNRQKQQSQEGVSK